MKNRFAAFGLIFGGIVLFSQAPAQTKGQDGASVDKSPEDLVAARAVPYKPSLTRDPFASPTDLDTSGKSDLVDDVAVKGVVRMGGKLLAVISDSRGNIRWLPVGFRFKDGEISAIDDKSVSFHQWDVNSTVRTAFRTVVKTFKREEGKR